MAGKPQLYNAWFCPFAQRAWIGILHRKIDFDLIEQDPYDKTPEWITLNPRGLVPALIHNNKSIYESTILLEYLDEAWPTHSGPKLLPEDPYSRFWARAWGDHVNKKITPPLYRCLQKKDEDERSEAKNDLTNAIKYIFENADKEGPYFMGKNPGYVDFMLVPFAFRIKLILGHYRNYKIPGGDVFTKFEKWFNNVIALDCVKQTLADEDRLIEKYDRYAEDTAQTEVATAIRKGTVLP